MDTVEGQGDGGTELARSVADWLGVSDGGLLTESSGMRGVAVPLMLGVGVEQPPGVAGFRLLLPALGVSVPEFLDVGLTTALDFLLFLFFDVPSGASWSMSRSSSSFFLCSTIWCSVSG